MRLSVSIATILMLGSGKWSISKAVLKSSCIKVRGNILITIMIATDQSAYET